MIREIIVVEGKSDTTAVRRAVGADTLETGGSALSDETLERIRLAQARRGVIVFTDPDYPGERIRKLIAAAVPGCKHAFLRRDEARGRDGLGVEHASDEAIRRALAQVRTDSGVAPPSIAWQDLLDAGLIHHPQAASRRRFMGDALGIGYCNGKQFYKRCNALQISREEFAAAYRRLEEETDFGER